MDGLQNIYRLDEYFYFVSNPWIWQLLTGMRFAPLAVTKQKSPMIASLNQSVSIVLAMAHTHTHTCLNDSRLHQVSNVVVAMSYIPDYMSAD